MKKRICENAGLELSILGAGCWAYGGGEYWGGQDQQSVNRVVHASVDAGINYFDTAEAYNEGRSEISLGEALKGRDRDKFLIGTKVSPSNCHYDTLIEHCHASLKRLQTDYIDIYMIHWPIHPHAIRHFTDDEKLIQNPAGTDEAIEALRKLKKEGKIRHFGVSNFGVNRLNSLPLKEIAVNELPYNLLSRAIEFDVLAICKEAGLGVISYFALLQGLLAGIYKTLDDVPVWQRRTRHFDSRGNEKCRHGENGCEEETFEALDAIRSISKKSGYSMAELSIKWIIANRDITCTLVGSRSVEELNENVKTVNEPLESDILDELNQVTEKVKQILGNHIDYYEAAEMDRSL